MDWDEQWLSDSRGEVPPEYRLRANRELGTMGAFGALAAGFYVALGTTGTSGNLILGFPVLMWLTVATGACFFGVLLVARRTGASAKRPDHETREPRASPGGDD